jgi:hypothetical protein
VRGPSENPERGAPPRPSLMLPDLERWVENGAHWRAIEVSDELVVVELRTCYGEPVDTLKSTDPPLIEYVRAQRAG